MRAALLLLLFAASASAQTFTAVPDRFPVDPGFVLGPAVVDVDANGLVDLIGGDYLFLQRADGFTPIPIPVDILLGTVAGDTDEDGVLELALLPNPRPMLASYDPLRDAIGVPMALPIETNDGPPDILLRGTGDGFFSDVSSLVLPDIAAGTYGMAAADVDKDGDLDVAIGLCRPLPAPNLLYRREATGYVEVGGEAGMGDPLASWGVAWLDYDGDSWLDLYAANMVMVENGVRSRSPNTLFRNNRDGTFSEVAAAAGVAGPSDEESWNVVAADFDNDGHIDLFVANQPQPSRLYRNLGDGTFDDVTEAAGLVGLADGGGVPIGVAAGDVDGDGWVDLFLPGTAGRLFLNEGGTNGWLAVRLRGTASNTDGVGARVEVTAGGRTQVREITAGDGMMAHSHALEAHVGLGEAATADVTVFWPSGEVTTVSGLAARQRVTIVEGEGPNAAPGRFALDAVEGTAPGTPLTLSWAPAEDDGPVTYTATIRHANGTERSWTTTETSVQPVAQPASAAPGLSNQATPSSVWGLCGAVAPRPARPAVT